MAEYEHGNGWIKHLPDTLRIGSYTYTVKVMPPGYERASGGIGECSNIDLEIRLGSMMKEQQARVTLFHETIHALLFAYGISDESVCDWQEHLCSVLPMAMMLFARDNPDAFGWIFPASHNKTYTET